MRIEGIAWAALRAWDAATVQVPAAGARPYELRGGGALTGRRSVAMDIGGSVKCNKKSLGAPSYYHPALGLLVRDAVGQHDEIVNISADNDGPTRHPLALVMCGVTAALLRCCEILVGISTKGEVRLHPGDLYHRPFYPAHVDGLFGF